MINTNVEQLKHLMIYLSGFVFAVYFLTIFILSSVGFMVGSGISQYTLYISIITSIMFCYFTFKLLVGGGLKLFATLVPASILIIGLLYGVAINRNVYDTSFDGQSYQGEAVSTLIEGWNPFIQPNSSGVNPYVNSGKHERWLDAYPKASWYSSVAIHRITGNFNDTKYFSLSLIVAVACVVYATLRTIQFSSSQIANTLIRSILTLFFAINPILIQQSTTLNLDGQIYAFITMLGSTLILLYQSYNQSPLFKRFYYLATIILFIILANIKTAGLVYGGIFLLAYGLFVAFSRSKEIRNILLCIIASASLGIAIFGYNPYLTNLSSYGNVLYPQFGKYSFDYIENTPSNYRTKNNVEVFFTSLFFKSDAVFLDGPGEPAELKLPLTVYESELTSLHNSQLKKGGLGPLFSGMFIIGLIGLLFGIARIYINISSHNPYLKKKMDPSYITSFVTVLFITIVALLSFFITKTSNTYRYIPHLWLLVGIWIVFGFSTKDTISRVLSSLTIFIALINSLLISSYYFTFQIEKSKLIEKKLTSWSTSGDSYELNFGYHTSIRRNLIEHNVPFKTTTEVLYCPPFRDDLKVIFDDSFSTVYGCIIS
jgi:hypothetical protein